MTAALTHSFPWATVWAAVAAVVGLVAIIVAIALWRLGTPRRLITYTVPVTTSLLSADFPNIKGAPVEVDVAVNGEVVVNPYFMELFVQSRSRRDIRASDFDQDRPLVFQLGASIVGVVGNKGNMPIIEEAGHRPEAGSVLAIYPMLIRKGDSFHSSLLLNGRPHITVRNPLVNVEVKDQAAKEPWWRRNFLGISGRSTQAAILIIIVLALVVAAIFPFILQSEFSGSTTTKVPQLIGEPVGQVVTDLHGAMLHLGAERFVPSGKQPGIVVDQYPGAGAQVNKGGQVSIVVSQHG